MKKQCHQRTSTHNLGTKRRAEGFVDNNFPQGSPLQAVFVGEDESLSVEAFLAKLLIWLKLIKLSTRN